MSIDVPADAPPENLDAGWHEHPQHPTVQRYWDGAAWTGEHRFALFDDALSPAARADLAAPRSKVVPARPQAGSVWVGVAFGVPWLYVGGAYLLAETVDGCSTQPQESWALGVGVAMWVGTVAAAQRGLRLLDVRPWLRVLLVAFAALHSAWCIYLGVAFIALAAWCLGC